MKLKAGNYLTVEEIVLRTKRHRTTIFRWIKSGKIKPTYIGDLTRFYEKDVKHLFVN